MLGIKIASTGVYVPEKIQTSEELSELIGRSPEWIKGRSGVHERRIAEEPMDVQAARAAKIALGDGGAPDCIINGSATPLQLIPDSSVFIQKSLGFSGIPSWSTHATCLSFIVSLINAASLVHSGIYRRVLLVSSETGTAWRNFREAESASLFGDAAAAAVVEPTGADEQSALLDWQMETYPEGAELTQFRGSGTRYPPGAPQTREEHNVFSMEGLKVLKMGFSKLEGVLGPILQRNSITLADIDHCILHQASGPMFVRLEKLGFTKEKTLNIVQDYGNCIAASIPMTLAIANQRGLLKRGDTVLLGGTGAGLSMAFCLLKW